MKYITNSTAVMGDMLKDIGLNSIDQLFADIPEKFRFAGSLGVGTGLSELEVQRELSDLAAKNVTIDECPCFLGAGAYDHYIPAAVEQLLSRSEFYSSYTPYQAEISQGILQYIFEYQTLMCELTGMDVANASMYDAGSALAEACNMAAGITRKKKILLSGTVNPDYRQVVSSYSLSGNIDVQQIPVQDGVTDWEKLSAQLDKETAAVVVQQPNFYGCIEDLNYLADQVHTHKALLIIVVDPISLAVLKTPGEYGADIAVAEGQVLGSRLNFGGPYLGILAVDKKYMRKIPGRLVGETLDMAGNKGYVLTLQAREQHIRREQASSNICSNHSLNALAATIYISLVGAQGLRAIALRSHHLALYAQRQLSERGVQLLYKQPFLREFAVQINSTGKANQMLEEQGIIGGYRLNQGLLLAFTEKRTKEEIDRLVEVLGGIAHE